jgi:pimeloyl-ACP methyl ester carboxylesterase
MKGSTVIPFLKLALGLITVAAPPSAAAAPTESTIEASGPKGPLAGTMLAVSAPWAVGLIIPGSGPTDRDGNSPLGVRARPYRLLAEALAARGISSVRIDKRGLFGSARAVADANAVTIADYAADVHRWVDVARGRTGAPCVWLIGHSEGGLVALAAAQKPDGICGLVLLAAPGRKLGEILREQLRANPANVALLPQAEAALASLEAGTSVNAANLPPALAPLFAPQVQPYLIDLLAQDPAALAAKVDLPILVVQGLRDIQVAETDARRLAAARPGVKLILLPGVNHVLKAVVSDGRADNLATYGDPALPLAPAVADSITQFFALYARKR